VSTSPEATAEELQPKYTPEDLRNDPAKLAEATKGFEPSVIDSLSSTECDLKLKQAIDNGLIKRNVNEDMRLDDTFGGVELVATTPDVPDVEELLDNLKSRKLEAIREQTQAQLKKELTPLASDEDKVAQLAYMLEQSYRRGDVSLYATKEPVPAKPAQQQKGKQGERGYQAARPAVPGQPGEFIINPTDKRQLAITQAFLAEVGNLPEEQQDTFTEAISNIGNRKGAIERDEAERKAKAKAANAQDQRDRQAEARRKIAEADKVAAVQKQEQDRLNKYGDNQVVLKAGTVVEGVDRKLTRNQVRHNSATGEYTLKADTKVTDQDVVDSARKEMERALLERKLVTQHGEEKAEELLQQHDAAEAKAADDKAKADKLVAAQAERDAKRTPAEVAAIQAREAALGGMTADQIRDERNAAHADSLQYDSEARGQSAVHEQYQAAIDRQTDVNIKKLMTEARDRAVQDEKNRQVQVSQEHADRIVRLMGNVTDMQARATRHESHKETVRTEEEAQEVRAMLNVAPLPSTEIKSGGFRKGPKMLESWFEVPGNPHLWVVERYNRRTGEMISQTMVSSEEAPDVSRNGLNRPPQSAVDTFAETRADDQSHLAQRPNTKADGSEGVKDKVRGNFRMGDTIDGQNGRYHDYINDYDARNPPVPGTPSPISRLDRHRGRGIIGRTGSLMYWLNRVGKGTPQNQQRPKGPIAPK
jgi:hypothetical protein